LPTFDPLYGELLTSREVAERTGFTMNQLRNWRMPERYDKMPFGFLRKGGASFYRKDVIDAWLESNGVVTAEYVQADIDKQVPLNSELANNPEKTKALAELAKITTKNAYTKWATWFTEETGYPDPYNSYERWMKELWSQHTGEPIENVSVLNYSNRGQDLEKWWSMWVWSMRKAWVEVHGVDVSDEELMALPIGDVPPSKLD
jgi:hypothetical protein